MSFSRRVLVFLLILLFLLFIPKAGKFVQHWRNRIDSICPDWKSSSSIDVEQFEKCFYTDVNEDFWLDENIRHRAFKNLLNSSSLIIEVGGNRGHDTERFIELYDPFIISYEPLSSMNKKLEEKFLNRTKIQVQPFGLGNRTRQTLIERVGQENIASSIFHSVSNQQTTNVERIQIFNIVDVIHQIRKNSTGFIDMITMNCEGCEFEILPALMKNDLIRSFRIIQIATHVSLIPSGPCIYCEIQNHLRRTHRSIYHYHKLWEAWILRDNMS